MNIETVMGAISLLLYWRVTVCLVISTLATYLLVQVFPWFSGLQGAVFAALGLLPGVMWEETAHPSSIPAANRPPTSTVVAVLAAGFLGAVWGAMSSTSLHSALAGGLVVIVVAWGWFQFAVGLRGWLTREQGIICALVGAAVYPVAALMAQGM